MPANRVTEELKKRLLQQQRAASVPAISTPWGKPQQATYNDMLNKALEETYRFARQDASQLQSVADTIAGGGMVSYKPGDLNAYNQSATRQAVRDQATATRILTGMGLFDDEAYAFNPKYIHLPGDEYLRGLLGKVNADLTASMQADKDWAEGGKQKWYDFTTRQSAISNKLADMDAQGRNYYDTDALEEADLLWFDQMINGNARWRPNWASQADVDRYNALVDQWAEVEDWENFDLAKYLGIEAPVEHKSQTELLKARKNLIEEELGRSDTATRLEAEAKADPRFAEISQYKGEKLQLGVNEESMFSNPYFFINNTDVDEGIFNQATNMTRINYATRDVEHYASPYLDAGYEFLDEEELLTYNYYYQTDKAKAAQYLESKSRELTGRRATANKAFWETLATNKGTGWLAWLSARGMNLLNANNAIKQGVAALTGTLDPNASYFDNANAMEAIAEAQQKQLGNASGIFGVNLGSKNIAQHLYGAGTGLADSGTSLAIDAMLGGTGWINQGLMAANAFSQGLQGSAENNEDVKQSLLKGGVNAFLSYTTEKIGVGPGDMLGNGKGVLAGFLNEGAEELLENLGSTAADEVISQLFGTDSQYKKTVRDLRLQGVENPEKAAILSKLEELATDFVYGGIAGGALTAPAAIARDSDTRAAGRDLQQNGDVEAVLKIAESFAEGTEANSAAKSVREELNKKHKVSNRKLGKMITAVTREVGEQNARELNQVLEDSIQERLVELGEDSGNAKKLAPVIRNIYQGRKITRAERAGISWTDNAEQVVKEMSSVTAEEAEGAQVPGATEAPEGQRVGQRWKTQTREKILRTTIDGMGRSAELATALTTKADAAVEGSARNVQERQKGKPKLKLKEISYIDSAGAKVNGTYEKVVKRNGKLMIAVRDAHNEMVEVEADAIDNAEAGLATIIEHAAHGAKHDMSAEEVNAMAAVYQEKGGDVRAVIRQFEDSYLAGYSGLQRPQGNDRLADIAYEQGAQEAAKDEEQRIEKTKSTHRNEKPRVTWLGEISADAEARGQGDEAALEAEYDNLTEGQQMVAEFSRHLAEQTGLNVVLFRSKARDNGEYGTQNGSYDSATHTIYLDVNAGNLTEKDAAKARKQGTLGYAIMRTMGHEVTHAIEATSPTFYAKYREAVKRELQKAGKDWTGLVRAKLDSAVQNGEKLTYGGAVAEVVADASEYMLQDSAFVNNLDTSLKGKVKAVIKDFTAKIKAAFRNLTGGSAEARALRNDLGQYNERLQKLWDAAFVEMQNAGEAYEYPTPIVTDGENIVDATEANWPIGDAPMPTYRQFSEDEENEGAFVSYADEADQGTVQKSAREQTVPVEELPRTRQFELRRNVEQREDGLMAMHNLKLDDVWGTIKLGGFPMPSIAIVKAKHGHTMYGPFSVIFGRETIDPAADRRNRVYGADAWTPVFPRVETEIKGDILWEVQEELHALAAQVDDEYGKKARTWFGNFSGSDVTAKTMEEIAESAANNTGVMAAYLAERGETVQVAETDAPADQGYNPEKADQYEKILDIIDMNDYFDMPMYEFLNKYGDKLAEVSGQLARVNAHWKNGDNRSGVVMARIIKEAIAYEGSGRDRTVKTNRVKDYYATDNEIRRRIDRADFEAWVKEKLSPAFGEQGIYNGKDRFTHSGIRRTFKQTHNPLTADNVVKSMLTQEESAIPTTDAKGLMAAAASMYKSIAEIKGDVSRLGKISEEEYRARIAAADNAFRDFLNAIEAWDYDQIHEAGSLLVEAAKKRMNASAISTLFKKNGYPKANLSAAIMGENVIQQVQSIPTGYFEAKPARVVGFDEIKMLIAPDDMPKALAAKLDELGIPYTTYDGTDEDRLAKANAVENVQFSRRTAEPDSASIREMLGGMQPTARMTETEKLLLKRYQEKLAALEEKEKQIEAQEQIIRTAPVPSDDLTKAKNRYRIYRTQANRIARELAEMEGNDGFARLMATSQEVVNRFLLGSSGSVADASNELDEEIADLTAQLKAAEAEVTRTVSGQRTAFARGLFDQTQLNAAAKKLKDAYGSRMSIKTISDRLALVYGELYATKGPEGAQLFMAAAKDLAYDLLKQNKFRYKSELLPLLTEEIGSISLTETDVQEIYNAGLTLSEYKRRLRPYISVVEGGSDLSSVSSNAAYYGAGALAAALEDETEGNLAMRLYNLIGDEKAKEAQIGYEGLTEEQLIGEAMADIAGVSLPLSQDSKTIDYLRKELLKYAGESAEAAQRIEQAILEARKASQRASGVWTAAVRELETAKAAVTYYRKLEEHRRLTEQVEQKQQITEQLKTEYAERLQKKVEQQRTEFREREQRAREYRHAREDVMKIRRKIGRDVKRLNALRMRATDQKHVPEELNHTADLVMQTFTDSSLARLAFSSEKAASLERRYRLLQELQSDVTYYWDDEIEAEIENLMALSEAYNAIRERGPGVPSHLSAEGVQLETEILNGVDHIVSNVLRMIDSANDAFLKDREDTFNEFATKTGEAIRQKDDYKLLKGGIGKLQTAADELLRAGNMTPVYFMEHLDSPEMMAVFNEIRKGQSDYARIVAEGKTFVEEAKARHHYGAWVADGKLVMRTSQGHEIELTREEAAEIYAIAKREKANQLYQTEHLLYGGFRYKDASKKGSGKTQVTNVPHSLDAADIDKIGRWLTAEQKAYADELVGFLSTNMADYGNAASMAMYGYRKFTEKYYIPFHVAAEQRYQRGDEGPQGVDAGTGRIRNSGFTHKVQHKANATLVVGGLTDTVAEHIHKMATYAALVEPIENMKRLLNHKVMERDGTTNTIRALIGQKYGKASQDYMTNLLKDLNGAANGDERATKGVNAMIGMFKRGAVMASASVVLQQPTAMARAMAYISPKYFAQNPFYRPGKGTWDEMMKYAGTAVIKDMGKFDVGMGLTATQYISDEHLTAMEAYSRLKAESKWEAGKAAYKRALDWLTAAPGKADQWTWGLIWKAVKAEQAALHPDMDQTSEEFLRMCGERFDDVIDHTQVYDSVITRSDLMRSKNALHKIATSFMSEPTLSLNMLYDAFMGKHDKKQRGKILGGVIVSQVLAGAMAALAQAWNDDEDKRNVLERYADRATANIRDNLNPLSMIPYVSDLMSMLEGYSVERPDMAAIADIIDYGKTFFSKATDPEKDLSWKDYENFIGTLANMAGLPAKNISREIRRTRNLILNSQWNAPTGTGMAEALLENVPFYSTKNAAYYERIVAAEMKGDTQKAEDYREYMLLSKMVSEDSLKDGLKDALRDAYIAGRAEEDAAIQYLMKIGAADDENDAWWEVDKWNEMRDEGIAAGEYRKYDDFLQAVETGENLKATIKEYMDHGVSKTTLATQITNGFKQRLIDAKKAGKGYADLQARILTAYEALGYDRQKKLKEIQKWFETK